MGAKSVQYLGSATVVIMLSGASLTGAAGAVEAPEPSPTAEATTTRAVTVTPPDTPSVTVDLAQLEPALRSTVAGSWTGSLAGTDLEVLVGSPGWRTPRAAPVPLAPVVTDALGTTVVLGTPTADGLATDDTGAVLVDAQGTPVTATSLEAVSVTPTLQVPPLQLVVSIVGPDGTALIEPVAQALGSPVAPAVTMTIPGVTEFTIRVEVVSGAERFELSSETVEVRTIESVGQPVLETPGAVAGGTFGGIDAAGTGIAPVVAGLQVVGGTIAGTTAPAPTGGTTNPNAPSNAPANGGVLPGLLPAVLPTRPTAGSATLTPGGDPGPGLTGGLDARSLLDILVQNGIISVNEYREILGKPEVMAEIDAFLTSGQGALHYTSDGSALFNDLLNRSTDWAISVLAGGLDTSRPPTAEEIIALWTIAPGGFGMLEALIMLADQHLIYDPGYTLDWRNRDWQFFEGYRSRDDADWFEHEDNPEWEYVTFSSFTDFVDFLREEHGFEEDGTLPFDINRFYDDAYRWNGEFHFRRPARRVNNKENVKPFRFTGAHQWWEDNVAKYVRTGNIKHNSGTPVYAAIEYLDAKHLVALGIFNPQHANDPTEDFMKKHEFDDRLTPQYEDKVRYAAAFDVNDNYHHFDIFESRDPAEILDNWLRTTDTDILDGDLFLNFADVIVTDTPGDDAFVSLGGDITGFTSNGEDQAFIIGGAENVSFVSDSDLTVTVAPGATVGELVIDVTDTFSSNEVKVGPNATVISAALDGISGLFVDGGTIVNVDADLRDNATVGIGDKETLEAIGEAAAEYEETGGASGPNGEPPSIVTLLADPSNANTGSISGDIRFGDGDNSFVNTGTFDGNITDGDDSLTFLGANGSTTGGTLYGDHGEEFIVQFGMSDDWLINLGRNRGEDGETSREAVILGVTAEGYVEVTDSRFFRYHLARVRGSDLDALVFLDPNTEYTDNGDGTSTARTYNDDGSLKSETLIGARIERVQIGIEGQQILRDTAPRLESGLDWLRTIGTVAGIAAPFTGPFAPYLQAVASLSNTIWAQHNNYPSDVIFFNLMKDIATIMATNAELAGAGIEDEAARLAAQIEVQTQAAVLSGMADVFGAAVIQGDIESAGLALANTLLSSLGGPPSATGTAFGILAPAVLEAIRNPDEATSILLNAGIDAAGVYASFAQASGNEIFGTFDPTWVSLAAEGIKLGKDFFALEDPSLLDVAELGTGLILALDSTFGGRRPTPQGEDDAVVVTRTPRQKQLHNLQSVLALTDLAFDPDDEDLTKFQAFSQAFNHLGELAQNNGIGLTFSDETVVEMEVNVGGEDVTNFYRRADNLLDDALFGASDLFGTMDAFLDPRLGWTALRDVWNVSDEFLDSLDASHKTTGVYLPVDSSGNQIEGAAPILVNHYVTDTGTVSQIVTQGSDGEFHFTHYSDLTSVPYSSVHVNNPPRDTELSDDVRHVHVTFENGESLPGELDTETGTLLGVYPIAGRDAEGKVVYGELQEVPVGTRANAQFILGNGEIVPHVIQPNNLVAPGRRDQETPSVSADPFVPSVDFELAAGIADMSANEQHTIQVNDVQGTFVVQSAEDAAPTAVAYTPGWFENEVPLQPSSAQIQIDQQSVADAFASEGTTHQLIAISPSGEEMPAHLAPADGTVYSVKAVVVHDVDPTSRTGILSEIPLAPTSDLSQYTDQQTLAGQLGVNNALVGDDPTVAHDFAFWFEHGENRTGFYTIDESLIATGGESTASFGQGTQFGGGAVHVTDDGSTLHQTSEIGDKTGDVTVVTLTGRNSTLGSVEHMAEAAHHEFGEDTTGWVNTARTDGDGDIGFAAEAGDVISGYLFGNNPIDEDQTAALAGFTADTISQPGSEQFVTFMHSNGGSVGASAMVQTESTLLDRGHSQAEVDSMFEKTVVVGFSPATLQLDNINPNATVIIFSNADDPLHQLAGDSSNVVRVIYDSGDLDRLPDNEQLSDYAAFGDHNAERDLEHLGYVLDGNLGNLDALADLGPGTHNLSLDDLRQHVQNTNQTQSTVTQGVPAGV